MCIFHIRQNSFYTWKNIWETTIMWHLTKKGNKTVKIKSIIPGISQNPIIKKHVNKIIGTVKKMLHYKR